MLWKVDCNRWIPCDPRGQGLTENLSNRWNIVQLVDRFRRGSLFPRPWNRLPALVMVLYAHFLRIETFIFSECALRAKALSLEVIRLLLPNCVLSFNWSLLSSDYRLSLSLVFRRLSKPGTRESNPIMWCFQIFILPSLTLDLEKFFFRLESFVSLDGNSLQIIEAAEHGESIRIENSAFRMALSCLVRANEPYHQPEAPMKFGSVLISLDGPTS
jgi:hypothetical protein